MKYCGADRLQSLPPGEGGTALAVTDEGSAIDI